MMHRPHGASVGHLLGAASAEVQACGLEMQGNEAPGFQLIRTL